MHWVRGFLFFINMALNIEQQECKEKILQFLSKKENDYFGIYGAGGTGKTYTISQTLSTTKIKYYF